jgi:DNA primase
MPLKTSQREWVEWLTEMRHISPIVRKEAGLLIHKEEQLAIPVRDTNGKLLFYKYRRSFKNAVGAKYMYDKGATAALFGVETLKNIPSGALVLISEGELDALALRSLGYHALSTTGGSGTWKTEWSALLAQYKVVVLYDADKAGVEGALKVASMTPNASIAWVPIIYGKDPTEVIHTVGKEPILKAVVDAKRYNVPSEGAQERLGALKALQSVLLIEKQECLADTEKTPLHVNFALDWVNKEIATEKKWEKKAVVKNDMASDIERARAYPITNLVKVNRQRKAKCLFHDDREPSMHVYDDHAFCYVCGKWANAIDIYIALNKTTFKETVAALQ